MALLLMEHGVVIGGMRTKQVVSLKILRA